MNVPADKKRPWLFEMYPELSNLPWTPLVQAPTPIQRLDNVSKELNSDVWIKRDDLCAVEYGGNKPRKLEFILGDALAKKKKRLITGGGIGTNHGLATTIFGRKLGFEVSLGLFKQPVTDHVRKCLRLYHAYGAEMNYVETLPRFVVHHYLTQRIKRPGAYFVEPGGSSILGTLGYVDAGLELAMQVKNGEAPEPEVVYAAAGTCGTLAGLVVGLKLGGLKSKVQGVRVSAKITANSRTALRLARGALNLMRKTDKSVPDVDLTEDDLPVDTEHLGPGYGHATPECRAAFDLMSEMEGIPLDLTYTAKSFGALCAHVQSGSKTGPALFLNSFNSVDLTETADSVDWHDLPEVYHRFFE